MQNIARRRRPLFWFLLAIVIVGNLLIVDNLLDALHIHRMADPVAYFELMIISMFIAPWVVKMPSGASWRPGLPFLMLSIFMANPVFTALVALPSLTMITARERAKWWKYPQTYAHVGLGLYVAAQVYWGLADALAPSIFGRALAAFLALAVHLAVNRLVSAMIVALREGRTLWEQLGKVVRELHWGYFSTYLMIFIVALIPQGLRTVGIALAAVLQLSSFAAVARYTRIEKLQKSLTTDGLTGAENRYAWEWLCSHAGDAPFVGCVAVIDLDNFKLINDKYGHFKGDQILQALAEALGQTLAKSARLFRVGGDEWVIVDTRVGDPDVLMQSVRRAETQLALVAKPGDPVVELSVGIAVGPTDGTDLPALFRTADARMYEAKRARRVAMTGVEVTVPEAVLSLVIAIESKDSYTAGHSLRVAFYALKLAESLGVDSRGRKAVFRAGLVHDVGKIAIPDAVLNKPDRLEPEELLIIRKHPEIGHSMCAKLAFREEELQVIRHHHERWDGTGYPDGLAGEQIPFFARLTAVADVYDALTSARSYRRAWTHQEAMNYLADNRGLAFDPVCVDAWLQLCKDGPLHEQFPDWVGSGGIDVLSRYAMVQSAKEAGAAQSAHV
ncbi:diguanylate cyclase (GGDEF) domain-containing protein/HDIG domain-containing protein [Alicyclobacillus hesperidum]|uniref:Diguanylate cyclase (GGDEF) domain-containing protein/HDIG domain-containing protein n=1 Tax=Alicyclobacillus hesperidum TaxID=89784 RepID=A0A1H2V8G0_9BACL|nr:diguanylate cyclase [Alicyclobacillus hesperidum]SDW64621.1 diguanylate cyclase (GGDEF) domain-containing protein/HDIG domain-containing protein [Alicyclobacillus hesperidum]